MNAWAAARALLAVAAPVLLAACGAAPERPAAAVPETLERSAPPPPETAPAPVTAAIPPPQSSPPAPAAVNDDPAQLLGLDPDAVEALLGTPELRRNDAPAQVWLYRGEDCFVDVFFYRDGSDEAHRVTHVELRRIEGREAPQLRPAERACFGRLLRTHSERGAG